MALISAGNSSLMVSPVVLGCMRIADMAIEDAEKLIGTALDAGVTCFDHADIYGGGRSESLFGQVLRRNPSWRDKMVIQSKCGIRKGEYDFSKEYITTAVEGILSRLGVDALDALLLHRPDALVEPEEVAEAFDMLQKSGKVKHFGVSNHRPLQIELLKTKVTQPIVFNQLQFSIMHSDMITAGTNMNNHTDLGIDRDGGVLDYCRIHGITIQAWSPLLYGFFEGVFVDNDKFPELNKVLGVQAEKYGVEKNTIAIAWILRHPAKMQAIVGTTNPKRLADMAKAAEVTLTRREWYDVYLAAGKTLP